MDADGNGLISRDEFNDTLKDERVARLLISRACTW